MHVDLLTFDKLSDAAKERARAWWRGLGGDFDGSDQFEDFANVAAILGIEFAERPCGQLRNVPAIYFSGFWSQGDGASFEGTYSYRKGCKREIREYAPQDTRLHQIADSLVLVQRRHFYGLSAKITQSGHYSHEYTMAADIERHGEEYESEELLECFRDFARWMYHQLESEYEYRTSDEQVDETILANEYTFLPDGVRYG